MPTKLFSRLKDDAKIEQFLENFYKTPTIDILLKPIFDIPDPKHCTGESDILRAICQCLMLDSLVV